MGEYKIVIPDTPVSINRLLKMHWAARGRIKNRFRAAVFLGVAQSDIPNDIQTPPRKVHIDVTIYLGGRGKLPDPDNMTKHLFDLLQESGVIHDDHQNWLSWTPPKIERDKVCPRTEVFVRY